MQLIQLHYFCTVARFGNMRRAADELWISQPALSKSISSLEEELGVRLFDRVGRSICLNEAGALYYEQISQIIESINDVTKQVRDVYNSSSNKVVLLLSAANFISDWIWQKFHQAHPEVNLMINSCYACSEHDIMQADFHISATPNFNESGERIKLVEERLMLAMGENHPLVPEEHIRLADVAKYPFQCLPPNENLRANLFNYCSKAGFQPQVAFCTEDSFTFFKILASNNFLTFLPEITAQPALKRGIVLKPITEPDCTRAIYISWDGNRYMSESAKTFLTFCRELFAREDIKELISQE